jgi:predicted secreted acid phosphatase
MKVMFKNIFTACCALFFFSTVFAEPLNLGLLRKEIQEYHDSGSYEKELSDVILKAQQYIVSQANDPTASKKKLAVVLDIDETSLTNYDRMAKLGFAANFKQLQQAILAADAPAIKPTLVLYNEALKLGMSVFFVTGRDESLLEATKTNLQNAGYKNWSGLYLRPTNYAEPSIVDFKAQTRAMISKKGYTIIATIGDQYSDLLGGYAKKEYKLPNPFYFLP